MKHFIRIGNNNYEYEMSPYSDSELGENLTLFVCESANIRQPFPNEDIPALLEDLGNLIEAEQDYSIKNSVTIRFRATELIKEQIQQNAKKYGYKNMSDYIKTIATSPESILQRI